MHAIYERMKRAVRRRPVRVVEALIFLVGALGLAIDPDAAAAILTLVALTVGGGEAAQTRTTPVADARLPDGHDEDAL